MAGIDVIWMTESIILRHFTGTNSKYKVYNFVKNCRNINYNIKYEILSHKNVVKIKKWNIIRI